MTDVAAATDLDVDEVDQRMAELPNIQVITEQEYKWSVEPEAFLGTPEPSPEALQRVLPLPSGAVLISRFRHKQSSIYFDEDWLLASRQLTLKALVNPGPFRNVSWLVAKHTIAWTEGCRDALEVSARIDPREIPEEVRRRRTLPMTYLERQCGRPLAVSAYAATTQVRHKLHLRSRHGALLQATFDVAATRLLDTDETSTATWLEIECTSGELRPRGELDAWARRISDHLGVSPHQESKPQVAARLAGWPAVTEAR